jgi:transposase
LFLFRAKRADYLKVLYYDGAGLCLFAKRLESGKFVWPPIVDGKMVLTPAQLTRVGYPHQAAAAVSGG